MNIPIGLIVTYVVDWIKSWWNKWKLKNLATDLQTKKEKALNDSKDANEAYADIMRKLAEYDAARSRDAKLSEPVKRVQSSDGKAVPSDTKPKPGTDGQGSND